MAPGKIFAYAAAASLMTGLAWNAPAQNAPADGVTATPPATSSLLELPAVPGMSAPPAPATPMQTAPPPAESMPAQPPPPAMAQAPVTAPAAPAAAASPGTAAVPSPAPPAKTGALARHQALLRRASNRGGAAAVTQSTEGAVQSKYPDILLEPRHLERTSLMFNKDDMNLLLQALDIYDHSARPQKSDGEPKKDFLNGLLDTLKHDETPGAAPLPLPNLYLGSIVYYSPANWSVWINGKKLVNRSNQESNEFFVSRISRSEVELVWRPSSLLDTPETWRQLTDDGAHPLPGIEVDAEKGKITLQLHPNQTFLSKSLAIREGLIKSAPAAQAAAPNTPANNGAAPGVPPRPMQNGGRPTLMNPMAPN